MAEPQVAELELGWVRTDGGTQMREEISEAHARDLIDHLDRIPPAVVFYDGSQYWLADGWHRLLAHSMAGKTHVRCLVYQGTLRDALLHAAGANADHGLKRTRKEAERAVRAVLSDPEWAEWSDHTIADMCRVSPDTVGSIRRKMAAENPESVPPLDAPRKGRDGIKRAARPGAPKKSGNGAASNGAAPADAPPTSTSEMRDSLGQVIPERLRDAFGDPFLRDTARQLRALEHTVKDVAARWAKHLRLSDEGHHRGILHALEEAYEGIEDGIPYAVHARCGGTGKGCHDRHTGCRGTGYVTWRLYEKMRQNGEW